MYTADDLQNLSEEDKKRKKRSVEMEVIILESDLKKLQNQKVQLEAEIRKIKYDEERLRVALEEKNKFFEKTTFDITQNEEEIIRLKKQLNLIT